MVSNATPTNVTSSAERRADGDAVEYFPRNAVNTSLLLLRVVVGVIFMMHGAQKVFGAFGGPGLAQMMTQMGPVLGFLVPIGEFFGGLGLVVGFLARFSAAANIVIMLGAIFKVHLANGFFAPTGFEYNLALIGLLLPMLILGPGQWAAGRHLPFLPGVAKTGRPIPAVE